MRRPMVAGNWKMNGSQQFAQNLTQALADSSAKFSAVDVLLCPPAPYLAQVAEILCACPNMVAGAQNVSEFDAGAYTGEVSTAMLKDLGCAYAIVGHSERRQLFAESNAQVAAKVAAAQANGIVPILCVGETAQQREADETLAVIDQQIAAVLDAVGVKAFADIIVAYEPVWAIGTGLTASPEQAQAVHGSIRAIIARQDQATAQGLRVLYGGSVKPDNADELFAQPDIDGGLIGGAALDASSFEQICLAAAK